MNAKQMGYARRAVVVAVQGALASLVMVHAGRADEDASVRELTAPTSQVEVGVVNSSQESYKAGEYNGLSGRGPRAVGNFDLRGGGAYDSNDATRWRLRGTDLGLQTRSLTGEYGEQGHFRFSFGFDELLRTQWDSYKTPYQNAGTTTLTLPSNWSAPIFQTGASMGSGNTYPAPVGTMMGLAATSASSPLVTNTNYLCRAVNISGGGTCAPNAAFGGAYTTPYAASAANTAMLAQNATDLSDFQNVNLSTKRTRYDLGVGLNFTSRWDASVSARREDKHGLKTLGVVNAGNGGYAAEVGTVIPELVDHSTDQINAALNYRGEHSFLTAAYYGSFFTNHAKAMTLDSPYATGSYNGVTQTAYGVAGVTITEEPDSTYNELRLTGGYDFDHGIKLVADAVYGRNAQNDPFILDPGMFATPTGAANAALNNGAYAGANSANARIITKSADLKLSAKPVRDLALTATYKYDERDNQTPVNTYVWYDAGAKNFGAASGGAASVLNGATIAGVPAALPLYSGVNIVANRPYSKRVNRLDADADYTLARGQAVKAGVGYESIDRHCSGTWIDCSFADTSRETTGRLEYRFHAGSSLSGRVAGDLGFRKVDYNPNAWMALNPALAATNIPALVAQGYNGSVLGFLNTYGLTANGYPVPVNAPIPNATIAGSAQLTAIYQMLFGTGTTSPTASSGALGGNGSLSANYYANHNITNNWGGLDIYNMANRDRSRFRGSVDWAALEDLTLQAGASWRHDRYPDSLYGLKNATGMVLDLDGDYAASEELAFSVYYTFEDQRSTAAGDSAGNGALAQILGSATGPAYTAGTSIVPGGTARNGNVSGLCAGDSGTVDGITSPTQYQVYNNNAKVDGCTGWQSEMRDKSNTIGVALTRKRFISPNLDLRADVNYSRAVTLNSVTGGFYYANPVAAFTTGVPAAYYLNAQALPEVTTTTIRLRLTGDYRVSKPALLRLSYAYANLHTSDYQYALNQPANTSGTVMPDFIAAPSYSVHVIGVSYVYRFQ